MTQSIDTTYCDRCGVVIEKPWLARITSRYRLAPYSGKGTYDLCKSCCDSLTRWVKDGRKK